MTALQTPNSLLKDGGSLPNLLDWHIAHPGTTALSPFAGLNEHVEVAILSLEKADLWHCFAPFAY